MMKLSIVTINYNDKSGLKKTLESVECQALDNEARGKKAIVVEHIIVDGGSTDGSVDIIKGYVSQMSSVEYRCVKWVSEKDNGIYDAMNKGVRMALDGDCDYIQILNSGDCLFSDTAISEMYNALVKRREAKSEWLGIVYGNMIRDYGNGKVIGKRRGMRDAGERQKEWTMNDFITGTINHDPTWIHRSLYEKYGLYDSELKICSDWKWFVNAVVFGSEQPMYVPINVTLFDVTGISETQLERRETERWNEIRKMLPHGVVRDYELYNFPIHQFQRLKRHHLWGVVNFVERVLCKLEKKGWIKK